MEHRLGIAGLVFLCLNRLSKVRVADFWRKTDLDNLYKQSLSQLTLTALFTKESRVCGLFGVLIYGGKLFLATLLSAEPTPSIAQGGQILRFIEIADLYRKNSLNDLKRGDQWSPLRAVCDLLSSVAEYYFKKIKCLAGHKQ